MPIDLNAYLREDAERISSYRSRAEAIERRLEVAYKDREGLKEAIENHKASELATIGSAEAIEKTIREAPKILFGAIKEAASVNTEFGHKRFLSPLREVAYNPETITIVLFENGNIKIKLNLNQTAGSLSDYGQGIKMARGELGTRSGGDIASTFWREKYYGAAREGKPVWVMRGKGDKRKKVDKSAEFTRKYWETVAARLSYSGKPAPYWEILDKGTRHIPNANRKLGEGIAYPENVATDFTGKAQRDIKAFYDGLRKNIKDVTGKKEIKIDGKTVDVTVAKEKLAEFDIAIKDAEREVRRLYDASLSPQKEILSRVEDKLDIVDRKLIRRYAIALKKGDIESLPFQSRNRIQVGLPGYDVRLRTSELLEMYTSSGE